MHLITNAITEFIARENLREWVERGIRVLLILALAWFFSSIARRMLHNVRVSAMQAMERRGDVSAVELNRRTATIMSVLGKIATIAIWLVALVMSLNELAFHIEPLLAGFGVVGLAVGLGAQTLIKDWLGGMLVLIEDQVRIGDAVTINGLSGTVEEINLRTTVLRGENGALHVISNGSINTLSNMTRGYSYYIFEATVAHGSNVDLALRILKEMGAELAEEPQYEPVILSPIDVMGVDRLSSRGIVIRARFKTIPAQQYGVGRELNRRVNARWEAEGIAFPPPE